MTDPQTQREQTSMKQLAAVSQARRIRLQSERQLLAERERSLAQAMESQRLDEALLDQQRVLWSGRWQDWAQTGGELRHAVLLREDKDLLMDMASLFVRRRAELQRQADRLNQDLGDWAQRWRGAEAFEQSLAARRRALSISLERASERQRDEESLMTLAPRAVVGASFAARG
jgi:hypothetical protein